VRTNLTAQRANYQRGVFAASGECPSVPLWANLSESREGGGKHALAPALSSNPFYEAVAIKPIARVIDSSSQISDWAIPANHSPTLPQRRECGPQLLNEQVGLFKGSKVTASIKLIPVDQV
jgi:hypothetical protein